MARKPDFILKALSKQDSSRMEVGAGWANTDGSISLSLNPCVYLTRNEDIVLTLFPNVPKPAAFVPPPKP